MRLRAASLIGLLAGTVVLALAVSCQETNESPTASTSPPPSPSPFAAPYSLVFGSSAKGRLAAPGQVDLYSFYATAGTLVQLDIDAQVVSAAGFNGQALNARLLVYDSHAVLQAIVQDGTEFTTPTPLDMRDPFLDFTVPTPSLSGGGGTGTYLVTVDDANGKGGPQGYDYYLWAKKPAPVLPVTASQTCPGLAVTSNATYTTSIPAATTIFNIAGGGNAYANCVGGDVAGPQVVFQLPPLNGKMQVVASQRSPTFHGKLMITAKCPPTTQADCLIGGAGAEGASGVVFNPAGTTTFAIVQGNVGTAFTLDLKTFPPFE